MFKQIGILIVAVITSFYFFPFNPAVLPAANTKMILAAMGLVWVLFDVSRRGRSIIDYDFFVLSLWACVVSLVGLTSVIFNETPDYTYAGYIVSMWVWLGGAYMVVSCMRLVHGKVNALIVCNYLILVCCLQCLLALAMDKNAVLKDFISSLMTSEGFMGVVENRMYGLGAALDVAGMRFAAVLAIIAFLVMNIKKRMRPIQMIAYILAFFIITVIGNMIGRTTTLGTATALAYIFGISILRGFARQKSENSTLFWKVFGWSMVILIPTIIYLYNTDEAIHENLRFAFEGFFSLVEKGKWETNSNNRLAEMVVFPDNMKTWIIGDGYFDGPSETDPYYTGPSNVGFYKFTDIGYLRLIFYFGVIGLVAFGTFLVKAAEVCAKRLPAYKVMFYIILLLNFVIWFKVSSDLFLLFALFLCLKPETEREEKEAETDDEGDAAPARFSGR